MTQKIFKLLQSMLVCSLVYAQASVDSYGKTFVATRPHGFNSALQLTTSHELNNRYRNNTFGGNLHVSSFYNKSLDGKDLATYFLFNKKNQITLSKAAAAANNTANTAVDLDLGYIIHDNADIDARSAKITFDPEQRSYGFNVLYYHDLSKICSGAYFYFNAPIVQIENNINIRVSSSDSFADATIAPVGAPVSVQAVLQKYFNGSFQNSETGNNRQAPLNFARIAGKQQASGFADVTCGLGYKFIDEDHLSLAFGVAGIFPTGNVAQGTYLFEPIRGNGKHFGLGADLESHVRLFGDWDHNLKLSVLAQYRYLFSNNEYRTFGINGRNWGQYQLVDTVQHVANAKLIPAANILTLLSSVTPGHAIDGSLNLGYTNQNMTIDIGYNLYAKQKEHVAVNNFADDGKYAVVARNFPTNVGTLKLTNVQTDGNNLANATITKASLDVEGARSADQVVHSGYGSIGYVFKEWDNPLLLSIGGAYHAPTTNAMMKSWEVWTKIGVGF